MLVFSSLFVVGFCQANDDYQKSAESAIRYQNFPWEEAGELSDFQRREPGNANSLNRASVPLRPPESNWNWNYNLSPEWIRFFNIMTWIAFSAAIFTVAGLLIWLFLKMEKQGGNVHTFSDYDDEEMYIERINQLPFELKSDSSGNLSDQARQLAASGDYSRATMFLFSHVLLSLDKHELIRLKRGKTNRQYLQELRRHKTISSYYQKVMIPFEDSFFGNHQISESRFQNCWHELSQFEDSVGQAQQVAVE